MKILHINSYYNGSMFYKNLFDYQLRSGLDISVFVPVSDYIDNQKDFGSYTTISKNHTKYDRFIFHVKQIKIYNDLIRKNDLKNFSIIHAHSLFTNGYVAMKIKKDFNIPYIVAIRNTDVNIFFRKMVYLRKLGMKILRDADRIIFISKPYRDEVIQRYIPEKYRNEIYSKSLIIPNGIDDYWFENIVTKKKEPSFATLRLLQIGDINKNKNIETTVKAIELLKEKKYDVKLDVVGQVKDQKVFDKIKDLNFVNYLGYKTKDELMKIYRKNDIFILPSINETFGLVYAEAMSQGLPVIYSKGQGFDGQFKNGEVGISVNPYDPFMIADAIIEILRTYNEKSTLCLELCNRFRWEFISRQYVEIYSILTNH